MRTSSSLPMLAALLLLTVAKPAQAAVAGLKLVANTPVPVFATCAPGDHDRLFIVENGIGIEDDNATALIRILDLKTGILDPTPFLTISGLNTNGEGGLLGLAFHPDYNSTDPNNPGRGKFYVNVTANDSDPNTAYSTYIREYTVSANPNIANTTYKPILDFPQPQINHNGGWLGFGPDNYLYIMTGDGGNGDDKGPGHSELPDASGNAQDLTNNFLGKILRVDVNGDDFPGTTPQTLAKNYAVPPTNPFVGKTGDDEIWAYGLRNPFRASFDRVTHDLWIGDVGESDREEINHQATNSQGGENYGWRFREGDIPTPTPLDNPVGGPRPVDYVAPVYAYTHGNTNVGPVSPAEFNGGVITGGYVYRGPDPSLQGKYFFMDAGSQNYWMADAYPFGNVTNINSLLTPDAGLRYLAASFGEDADGNLYVVYIASGEVYRIVTNQLLKGDFDSDGDVDADDYTAFRASFGSAAAYPAADGNMNATFDAADYAAWRKNFGASVHGAAGAGTGSSVPEPASAALLALQLTAVLLIARRNRSRAAARAIT